MVFKIEKEMRDFLNVLDDKKFEILELFLDNNPRLSYTEIKTILKLPDTKKGNLNYHLKELEKSGWLEKYAKENIFDEHKSYYKISKFGIGLIHSWIQASMKSWYSNDPYQSLMQMINNINEYTNKPQLIAYNTPNRINVFSLIENNISKSVGSENRTNQQINFEKIIQERAEVALTEKEIKIIVSMIPSNFIVNRYEGIFQLGPGKHSPCIHEAIPKLLGRKQIVRKSANGKVAAFECESSNEAYSIAKQINQHLKKFQYKANANNKYVIFETSPYTSISRILSEMDLISLYCKHHVTAEVIVFAKPLERGNMNIHQNLEKKKKDFREKFNLEAEFPTQLKKISDEIMLPNVESYDAKFIEFLIDRKPGEIQLKTHLALYHLTELGIPIQHIKKSDLITIIHMCTNTSRKTLEKHISSKNSVFHEFVKKAYNIIEPKNKIIESDKSELDAILETGTNSLKEQLGK